MATHIVCEGQCIQNAIDCACPGDTILVEAGCYQESLCVDENKHGQKLNNLHIVGVCGDVIIDGSCCGNVDGCTLKGVTGCEIKGCCFQNFRCNGILIECGCSNMIIDCSVNCCGKNCIEICNSNGNLIKCCCLSECCMHCICIDSYSQCNWCLQNKLSDCKKDGIICEGNNNAIIECELCNIGCDNTADGIDCDGNNCLIHKNNITDTCDDGIDCCSNNCIITDNCCTSCNEDGIDLNCGNNHCVLNNVVRNCACTGIECDANNCIIDGNSVSNCCDNGIELNNDVTGCVVTCNSANNNNPFDIKAPRNCPPDLDNTIFMNRCQRSCPTNICDGC